MRTLNLLLFLLLTAAPLALGIGYALLYSLGLTGLAGGTLTTGHWREVLASAGLWRSLLFSAYVAGVSIGVAAGVALLAVGRGRGWLSRGWLSHLVYLPLTLPAMVVAFFIFQMLAKAGLLARLSYQAGLIDGPAAFPDLINDPYGIGIIVAHVLMATPFFTILFANLHQAGRLPELAAAAATLGATPRQVMRRVVAPILLRRASPTLLLYGIFVMSSYEIPLLLGSQSREMIAVLTIRKLQRFNLFDIPQAYAISVLYSALVVLAVIWLLGRKETGLNRSS